MLMRSIKKGGVALAISSLVAFSGIASAKNLPSDATPNKYVSSYERGVSEYFVSRSLNFMRGFNSPVSITDIYNRHHIATGSGRDLYTLFQKNIKVTLDDARAYQLCYPDYNGPEGCNNSGYAEPRSIAYEFPFTSFSLWDIKSTINKTNAHGVAVYLGGGGVRYDDSYKTFSALVYEKDNKIEGIDDIPLVMMLASNIVAYSAFNADLLTKRYVMGNCGGMLDNEVCQTSPNGFYSVAASMMRQYRDGCEICSEEDFDKINYIYLNYVFRIKDIPEKMKDEAVLLFLGKKNKFKQYGLDIDFIKKRFMYL